MGLPGKKRILCQLSYSGTKLKTQYVFLWNSWETHGYKRRSIVINIVAKDIPENGADVAHLDAVHSASIMLGGEPTQAQEDNTENISKSVI